MKKLFTLILIAFASFAQAQDTTCVVCTKPTITGVIIQGNDLGVGWDNSWFWGTGCSKHIVVIINGIEYLPNPNMGHGNAASSQSFAGIVPSLSSPICVVVRNYCNQNLDSYYVDSDPTCVVDPVATAIDCKCGKNGKKYTMTKPGLSTACVSKYQCQTMLGYGWSNDCNCN